MTSKDWIYLAMTVGGYLVAIIAGIYAKNKTKINKTTAAGKAMDVVGQLATYAVHEADKADMSNEAKKTYASEVVTQGLSWLGVKGVTPIIVSGAVEDAVNAMRLANGQITGNVLTDENQAADGAADATDAKEVQANDK